MNFNYSFGIGTIYEGNSADNCTVNHPDLEELTVVDISAAYVFNVIPNLGLMDDPWSITYDWTVTGVGCTITGDTKIISTSQDIGPTGPCAFLTTFCLHTEGDTHLITVTYNPPNSCSDIGDLNSDCEYNVVDVVSMVSLVLQAEPLTDEEILMSDMNGDGALNVVDVVLLVNIILGD